jgi:hypothetical protein
MLQQRQLRETRPAATMRVDRSFQITCMGNRIVLHAKSFGMTALTRATFQAKQVDAKPLQLMAEIDSESGLRVRCFAPSDGRRAV